MELSYYKANPTGNITLIVETSVPRDLQPAVAKKLMALDSTAEQVGFIEKPVSDYAALRLQMMGGEFCGNAAISAAALVKQLGLKGSDGDTVTLEISGAGSLLSVAVKQAGEKKFTGSVSMPLPESCFISKLRSGSAVYELPAVRFSGITHVVIGKANIEKYGFDPKNIESCIAQWCGQLGADALGVMFMDEDDGLLNPYVYVYDTGSSVWESSCASGTTAVAAYLSSVSGKGESISLTQPGGTLSAEVKSRHGIISEIILTGSAEIVGHYSVNI